MDTSRFSALVPHVTLGMSTFQMDNFVINDSITPYRKLRQAIIEAKTRIETCIMYELDVEEFEIKLEIARAETPEDSGAREPNAIRIDSGARKLNAIHIKRLEYELNRKRAMVNQITQEAQFFIDTIDQIVTSEYETTEQAVAALASPDRQYQEEQSFWVKKLARNAYADMVSTGVISKGVIDSIECLPAGQREAVLYNGAMLTQQFAMEFTKLKDDVLAITDR
jgi:hypothetical protein